MANKKISQLTDGTSFQAGDEAVVNRSGTNYKVDPTQFGSSIDVTGTVEASAFSATLDASSFNDDNRLISRIGDIRFNYTQFGGSGNYGGHIDFYTKEASTDKRLRQRIANNGDISFYEDTGTTPKFFWDASAESLELTNIAASSALKITKGNTTGNALEIINSGESRSLDINHNADGTGTVDDIVRIKNNGTSVFEIDSSGNVGIGTSSPDALLQLSANNPTFKITDTSTSGSVLINPDYQSGGSDHIRSDTNNLVIGTDAANKYVVFKTVDTERARIDSSGNLLVGTTTSPSDTGTVVADGIYLGGTGAANLLDDYETGTWTPVFEAEYGSVTTGASPIYEGTYTKIGDKVTCVVRINADYSSMAVDDRIRFNGLPFTPRGYISSNAGNAGTVGFAPNTAGGVAAFGEVYINSSATYEFIIWITHVDGSPTSWAASGTFTYFTDS